MPKLIIFLIYILSSSIVHADVFYRLVGFVCDQNNDRLVITYKGAYNEKGEEMIAKKSELEWEPSNLIVSMKDEDHIGRLKTISTVCKLKHATYNLELGPLPKNYNIQGVCGSEIAAWAQVSRGSEIILPAYNFEGEDCHNTEIPITTEIIFSAGYTSPQFKKVSQDNFFK